MKWNWGTGIFIFIVLFVAACVTFIIYAGRQKWSLVEEDYYPKELRHEEKLISMRNAGTLTEPVSVTITGNDLLIRFPGDMRGRNLEGKVHVYRPSDESLDIVLPLLLDSALSMKVPLNRLVHGKYIIKSEWFADNRPYYMENTLFIP